MGIRTLIAMAPSGIPYFSGNYICPNGNNCDVYSKDQVVQTDPSLISGFFTAVMNMAQLSGGELQQVAFEKNRYLAQSAPNLVMIMSIDIADDADEYKNRLTLGADIFLEHFKGLIDNWRGDVALFDAYQVLLEENDFFDHDPVYRKNCIECTHDQDCTFRMVTGIQGMNLADKMALYPKMSIVKKMRVLAEEYMKYLKQLKRYKKFQADYQSRKKTVKNLKIVDML